MPISDRSLNMVLPDPLLSPRTLVISSAVNVASAERRRACMRAEALGTDQGFRTSGHEAIKCCLADESDASPECSTGPIYFRNY